MYLYGRVIKFVRSTGHEVNLYITKILKVYIRVMYSNKKKMLNEF